MFNKGLKIFKKNWKFVFSFVLGMIMAVSGVYAVTAVTSDLIVYDNSSSGISATNVQDAIKVLDKKANLSTTNKFIAAYEYSTETSTKCITGEESTCVETLCYKSSLSTNCEAGTIVKYRVNDTDIVNFHVMYDNGTTLTMQSQRNTIYNMAWYGTKSGYTNTKGPMVVLPILENVTAGWSNVNDQTYTMGTTTFKNNPYTGCSSYDKCNEQVYTLSSRTAKARMITVQELNSLGCTTSQGSCPKWLSNYLANSTNYGGSNNDNSAMSDSLTNSGYWTMTAIPGSTYAWAFYGSIINTVVYQENYGARAVVVVSKVVV